MKHFNLIFSILLSTPLFAQFPGCPAVDAGPDVNSDCSNPCVDLVATPFNAGATSSYTTFSIPHNPPLLYNEPGGNSVSVGIDDIWSSGISLPFDFCFYGQTYNSCIVGSNGAIQFGTANAGGYHPWSFSASVPSPALIDAGNILGPYHDIDPSIAGTVKWYVAGSAPCRIFVVSFYQLAHFSCTNLQSTHMMVLYETTNAIDVYINNKATCNGWNSGNTVVGIQDMAGVQGIAAPGRNTGAWTVTAPEAWRFMPSGAPIYSLEWFDGGVSIGTNDTISVCPALPTTYTVEATYTSCNGTVIVETDEVLVTPMNNGLGLAEINNTMTSCAADVGSTEVSASGGVPSYNYSFNDTLNFQPNPIFTGLAAGTYTIYVQDAGGCMSGVTVTIDAPVGPDLSEVSVVNASCGLQNGEFEVSSSGGLSPYLYSINSGVNTQGNGVFTGLNSGLYLVQIVDANFCVDTLTIQVNADPFPIISVLSTDTICSTAANGEVTIEAIDGLLPYTFNVDSGASQTSPIFTGLTAGNHTFEVTDGNGCTSTVDANVYTFPNPTIQNDTIGCFMGVYLDGTTSYNGGVWSASDTAITFLPNANVENPQIHTSTPGNYVLTYMDNACNSEVTMVVEFPPYMWAFLYDTTLCQGVELNFQPNQDPSATTYSWSTGSSDTSILVTQPGVYTVTVSNFCHTANATGIIDFKVCDIEAPNILSLSSLVGNNLWTIDSEGVETFECYIINRWGNNVYYFNDVHSGWNGKDKHGNSVSEGTYFYIIDAVLEGGEELHKHGFIEVVH